MMRALALATVWLVASEAMQPRSSYDSVPPRMFHSRAFHEVREQRSPTARVRVVRHGEDRVEGITQVDVVVQVAADATGRCAVERASLASLAQDILRDAGIKATVSDKASSWFYSVVVSATVAAIEPRPATPGAPGYCAAFVETELVAQVEGIPEADSHAAAGVWGSLLVGQMPLLRKTDLVTGAIEEHDSAVRQAVRAGVGAIAAKLHARNP